MQNAPAAPPEVSILTVARQQGGAFAWSQALAAGFSPRTLRRRIAAGYYRRAVEEVYVVAGYERDWRQRAWIVHLAVPESVLSHRSVAELDRLDGFDRPTGILEVSVAPERRWQGQDAKTHRCGDLQAVDVDRAGPLPRTTTTRCLVDLGKVVPRDVVLRATMSALRRGLTSRPRLRLAVSRLASPGRAGPPVLRDVLDSIGTRPPSDSDLESRAILLCERIGLPAPQRQVVVRRPDGSIARIDLGWPEHLFGIELHGRHHDEHRRHGRDLRREAMLRRLGWRLIGLQWEDVVDDEVATMAFVREEARAVGLLR